MQRETIDRFSADVWDHVFGMLDDYFPEHEMSSSEAGAIATLVEYVFMIALSSHFGVQMRATDPHGELQS